MIEEHKIKEKISIKTFIEKINNYGYENVEATSHTFLRLSQKQRKIYTEKELKETLFNKRPIEVSIENNNNYAVLYIYNNKKILKIILDFTINKVYIVTFYFLNKRQEGELKWLKDF